MPKRRFLAAVAVSAALATGGAAALVLGVPGVSGAQTTTPTTPPTTTAPPADGTPAPGHVRGGAGCPNMGGTPGSSGSSTDGTSGGTTNLATRSRGPGGFQRV